MIRSFFCSECGYYVQVSGTKEQWKQFDDGRIVIQKIFPDVLPEDREIMLSRLCGECFDKLFEV